MAQSHASGHFATGITGTRTSTTEPSATQVTFAFDRARVLACEIFVTCMNIQPRLRDALLEQNVVQA
jgi:hypothetical protein